ncbi:MAG: NAD(P)-dependent oxidoreductase [Bacteroidia bacterium]|nr:NAD(P)-dependent oxidoreductase [Bacteroidia bacterium]
MPEATHHLLAVDLFPEAFLAELGRLPGVTIDYRPLAPHDVLLPRLAEADILLCRSHLPLGADTLAQAPRLRLILRPGVGLEHIDLAACDARGIAVVSTPGANADSVGEHAVGLLLSLLHRLTRADGEIRRGEWRREPNRGTELGACTVGIVGYGHTGSAVARKLQGFGCRVLAYDKYKTGFTAPGLVEEVPLRRLYAEADVLTLHVPLTDETRHLVTADYLERFARPIWLLNLSRGPVVVLEDLVAALRAGQVRGAGLDVYPAEPPFDLPAFAALRELPNVVLTPHTAGWSQQSQANEFARIVAALESYVAE